MSNGIPPTGLVLVTGGTGAVGPAVLRALMNEWPAVRCLSRARPDAAGAVPGVEYQLGDVTETSALARAVDGVDVVVHLAGLAHRTNPTAADLATYRTLNVSATAALCDLVAPATRVVLASSTAVYGPTAPGDIVNEQTTPAPDSPYASSKLEAETALWARHEAGRIRGVVLRFAAVYGPHVAGNYRALLDAVGRGLPVRLGSGRNLRTLVHEDDLAACVRLAATRHDAPGGTFNVTDGSIHRVRDIVAAMYAATGRSLPVLIVPDGGLRAAAWLHDQTVGRMRGRLIMPRLAKYCESSAVSGERARTCLGYEPRVTLEQGWRATWAAMSPPVGVEVEGAR